MPGEHIEIDLDTISSRPIYDIRVSDIDMALLMPQGTMSFLDEIKKGKVLKKSGIVSPSHSMTAGSPSENMTWRSGGFNTKLLQLAQFQQAPSSDESGSGWSDEERPVQSPAIQEQVIPRIDMTTVVVAEQKMRGAETPPKAQTNEVDTTVAENVDEKLPETEEAAPEGSKEEEFKSPPEEESIEELQCQVLALRRACARQHKRLSQLNDLQSRRDAQKPKEMADLRAQLAECEKQRRAVSKLVDALTGGKDAMRDAATKCRNKSTSVRRARQVSSGGLFGPPKDAMRRDRSREYFRAATTMVLRSSD